MEPKNVQAQQLKQLITEKQRRDTLITAGVVGGTALAGAAVVGGVVLLAAGIAKLASKQKQENSEIFNTMCMYNIQYKKLKCHYTSFHYF